MNKSGSMTPTGEEEDIEVQTKNLSAGRTVQPPPPSLETTQTSIFMDKDLPGGYGSVGFHLAGSKI